MIIEKNKSDPVINEIEFNWEQVKKKAATRKERLEANASNVFKREVITEPEVEVLLPSDNLPIPSTGREVEEAVEAHEPDRNAVELLKLINTKEIQGRDLTMDERRLIVKSLQELGQTQDAIANLLQISRRTIVSDYKAIRKQRALDIQNTETYDIAGEVYAVANTCIRRALAAGHFKTVSTIVRDMVEVLQSLGVVYRAPKTSMQATLLGNLSASRQGYDTYMKQIGEDKSKVINILDCMFEAIQKEDI